jgi:hypothetical protein
MEARRTENEAAKAQTAVRRRSSERNQLFQNGAGRSAQDPRVEAIMGMPFGGVAR